VLIKKWNKDNTTKRTSQIHKISPKTAIKPTTPYTLTLSSVVGQKSMPSQIAVKGKMKLGLFK
jgi:hypothetical protein